MAVVVEAFRVAGSVEKRQKAGKSGSIHSSIHSTNAHCDSEGTGETAVDTGPLSQSTHYSLVGETDRHTITAVKPEMKAWL